MAGDWVEKKDPKTGKTYFFNSATRETSWTKPAGMQTPSPELPAGWVEKTDPKSGKKYYFNKDTRETRWSAPPTPVPQDATNALSVADPAEPAQTETKASPSPDVAEPAETEEADTVSADAKDETSRRVDQDSNAGEGAGSASNASGDEDAAGDDNAAGAMQEPTLKTRTIEDVAQDMLAAAGLPSASRNPMQRLGNDVLLRMLGGQEGPSVNRRGSILPSAHAGPAGSSTQLMVFGRLNEEFRSASIELRDRFEDIMEGKRREFDTLMSDMKARHADVVSEKYARLERERHEAAAEEDQVKLGDATDPEVAKSMAVLEQRLFGSGNSNDADDGDRSTEGTATATHRRLLTFWKAKFRTATKQLDIAESDLRRDQRTLTELEDMGTVDPDGFGTRVASMRERVNAAMTRRDALRNDYEAEARKRGVKPEAPRRLTDAQLRALLPDAQGAVATYADHETKTDTASTALGAEFMDYFITELGHRDLKIRAATAQYYARREEADDLAMQVEDVRQSVEVAAKTVERNLNEFTEVAGSLTTAAASFYEEIIQLRSQIEAAEEAKFNEQLARAQEAARHATEMATLRHRAAEARLRYEHKRERHLRLLREKDVDLYRTQRRATNGNAVEFTDFTDAPTVDVKLHLDVLKAKLAVTDSEKQLLQHQLDRVAAAVADSERELNSSLR